VTQQIFDPQGQLVAQRDPRLFALSQSDATAPVNLVTVHGLAGQVLCSDSVDAGWQLGLPGEAGQALEAWDQRGWHRRTGHDSLLRPVAVHEQMPDEPERCVERVTWGDFSADHARHNRCGQPIRSDDPAGSRLIADYGLAATVLHERRNFLRAHTPVDWPALETDRDILLEPGGGAESSWTLAPTGEMITQTDARSHTRHFAYDRAGQLSSVGLQRCANFSVDPLVGAIRYSASGQVEHELTGNGMRTLSTYEPTDGRLTCLATQGPDHGYLQKLSYLYDPAGNISEIADAALPTQYFSNQAIVPVRRFAYDTLYQLTSATGWETARPSLGPALPEWQGFGPPDGSRWCNYSETYQYDEAGNLLQRIHHGAIGDTLTMRVAPRSNRSVKVHSTQSAMDESFDTRGNLLELQPGQALQWNGRNQLAQVTQVARGEGADDLESYVYDGDGTRLRKIRTSAAKSIVHVAEVRYLPGIELHSNSATGEQLQVISVRAGRCSVRLLHWDSPPPADLENDQLRFCFDDHLGSCAFEVDGQAKVISLEVYYPFGGTAWLAGRHEVQTSYKTVRYSGNERDATGLYYYGARYYAPWLQRWLNPDPAGNVDGLNFYRFVKNSPIVFVDKNGNRPILSIINDYITERNLPDGITVLQRGMKEIKAESPELAKSITAAVEELAGELELVVEGLLTGDYDASIFTDFFGEINDDVVSYLVDGFQGVLVRAKNLILKPGKIVTFSLPELAGDTTAFVVDSDRRNKIYLNQSQFIKMTTQEMVHVLAHELTHQSDVFMSMDLWYLSVDLGSLVEGKLVHFKNSDELQDALRVSKSRTIISRGIKAEDINQNIAVNFTAAAKAESLDEAVRRFNVDSAMRTDFALYNADTLAAFAGAVIRSRGQQAA